MEQHVVQTPRFIPNVGKVFWLLIQWFYGHGRLDVVFLSHLAPGRFFPSFMENILGLPLGGKHEMFLLSSAAVMIAVFIKHKNVENGLLASAYLPQAHMQICDKIKFTLSEEQSTKRSLKEKSKLRWRAAAEPVSKRLQGTYYTWR